MPQAPIYTEPLNHILPSTRCTQRMKSAVLAAAERYSVKVSDVVRICVANSFGLGKESSDFTDRMFRKTTKETSPLREKGGGG